MHQGDTQEVENGHFVRELKLVNVCEAHIDIHARHLCEEKSFWLPLAECLWCKNEWRVLLGMK